MNLLKITKPVSYNNRYNVYHIYPKELTKEIS